MTAEATIVLAVIAIAALWTAAVILIARRKERILADAPVCKDCNHAAYLSSHDFKDRFDYGVEWSSQDGYYCRLSEFKISSGGVAVTGYDKRRMRKCEDMRQGRCGLRARLFEVKP